MASLFTNASAQAALQTLRNINRDLDATNSQISTGKRINTAEDNAAYWSIATTLRSDVGALGAVKDALGLGAASVDTIYTGLTDTKDILDQIKAKLVAASQPDGPREQVQAEIAPLQDRLKALVDGETWLTQAVSADGYSQTVIGSFTRTGDGIVTDTVSVSVHLSSLIDIASLIDTSFDADLLVDYMKAVDDALQELTLSASAVGAAKARIESNQSFAQNLIDANTRGIGPLIDADLEQESTHLKALQVQEQLAIQALGIANASTQNILKLFQGQAAPSSLIDTQAPDAALPPPTPSTAATRSAQAEEAIAALAARNDFAREVLESTRALLDSLPDAARQELEQLERKELARLEQNKDLQDLIDRADFAREVADSTGAMIEELVHREETLTDQTIPQDVLAQILESIHQQQIELAVVQRTEWERAERLELELVDLVNGLTTPPTAAPGPIPDTAPTPPAATAQGLPVSAADDGLWG